MKELDLLSKLGFGLVLTVALAISWWSLFTLAISFGMPTILAIAVSASFDGAALFFAGMTSKYAVSDDNGIFPKSATYLMVVVSMILNIMHAFNLGLGVSGMIMFGASSFVAGLIFEVYLRYVHRKTLKEKGRVLDKLPLTGLLAMLVHPVISFRVINKAIKRRLQLASVSVSDFDDKDDIFKRRQKTKTKSVAATETATSDKPKTIKATAERQDKDTSDKATRTSDKQLETKDKGTETKTLVLVPKPETNMSDMSIAQLVSHYRGQGIEDRDIIRQEVSRIKDKDVPKATINKAFQRQGAA